MPHLSYTHRYWHPRGTIDTTLPLSKRFQALRNYVPEDLCFPKITDLADPSLFNDMSKAVKRIQKAITHNEKILVFGDYDMDGMSGCAQIYLTLKNLKANVLYKLPSRTEGYGMKEIFITALHKNNVQLLITTDCGISNVQEVEQANTLGIDTIITDHHSIPTTLPNAYAILHPLTPNETFPDPHITGAGVAYYLCVALIRNAFKTQNTHQFEQQLLELAVLGTVADCGILRGENRKIALLGIEALKKTQNKGLKKLFEVSKTKPLNLTTEAIAFFLAPRMNASGRLAHPHIALELLLGNENKAQELEKLNQERQKIVTQLLTEAEEFIASTTEAPEMLPTIILKSTNWPAGVIGLIAGRIAEKYAKPTIIMEEKKEILTASCRGPEDFHLTNALKNIQKKYPNLFLGVGGHAQAAGFSIYSEKLELFKEAFINEVIKQRCQNTYFTHTLYDMSLCVMPTWDELSELEKCEPFGIGNPAPVFLFPSITLKNMQKRGKDEAHLSFTACTQRGEENKAIFFRGGMFFSDVQQQKKYDLLATPEKKEWNGKLSIGLKVIDIRETREEKKEREKLHS